MPIEFIGMIGVRPEGADGAAVHVIGGEIDPKWVRDFSRAHEQAGFDKVLVGYTATSAGGIRRGELRRVFYRASRLLDRPPPRVRGAHAGRAEGRHVRSSSAAAASPCTSSPAGATSIRRATVTALDHDTRYRRTDEYLTLLRRTWTEDRPFDHAGEFYCMVKALLRDQAAAEAPRPTVLRRRLRGRPPDRCPSTRTSTCFGASRWPPSGIASPTVRAAAAEWGRAPRFSVSLRPIIAPTETLALGTRPARSSRR